MPFTTGNPKTEQPLSWEKTQILREPQATGGFGWALTAQLRIPDGWEPVAQLCVQIARRGDTVAEAIVERIRTEIPVYRTGAIPERELRESVAANLDMMLRGTAEYRGPTHEELERCRALGDLRAEQGRLPVNAMIQAFVVGYRALWDEVIRELRGAPPEIRELVLTAAATIWEWVHAVTDAVGTAYHDRIRRNTALASVMRERLFDALLGGKHDEDEIRATADSLGYQVEQAFRAIALAGRLADAELPSTVTAALALADGHQHAVKRGDIVLVLDQAGNIDQLLPILRQTCGDTPIGLGMRREGLHGAALSIGDAERALAVSRRSGRVINYERDWLTATVVASEARLTGLLSAGLQPARRFPELARTIRAFASSGFSMSQAARALHVHTNTVAYRLNRWTELTGWDPRTHDGLVRSMSAFALVEHCSDGEADFTESSSA